MNSRFRISISIGFRITDEIASENNSWLLTDTSFVFVTNMLESSQLYMMHIIIGWVHTSNIIENLAADRIICRS